ncbi:Quinolinate phosphoribosyltransferase [decarboxylating] [hydrothermal vent metagenome]|uniref:Probable nicotinate-nucleotide pyrophosphorylase [carboxylating] n=1 Tax=hydrothermal vent metagenome TaxID=652676 RepID=A0A3B1A115_9ZZZZ
MNPEALRKEMAAVVKHALAEDIGSGDITSVAIAHKMRCEAHVITREQAVLCGKAWFTEAFHQVDKAIMVHWHVDDGDEITPNQVLCDIVGAAKSVLTAERCALNFLQTLSGTATIARTYAQAVSGLPVKVLDTRKTIPGLRMAQKYAVTRGGCCNHRFGLSDGILIKDNHIQASGSLLRAIELAKAANPDIPIEVEVESISELNEALAANVDIILLDNFAVTQLKEAVKLCQGNTKLEASGGVSLDNIREIAETGVDYISVGALTKDVKAIDLSLNFHPVPI